MELKKGYKQTEVGVIPDDWEVKKIGDFAVCFAGGTPSTKESTYWNGDIKWMNSGELNNKFIYNVENRITEEGLKNSSTKLIPEKCVLIGLAGQGKTRGTAAINYVELCTNQSIAAIFPSKQHISKFLYYFLDKKYIELRKLSTGDGGRGGLNLSIIKKIYIPFPNFREQKIIAETLSDVDILIYNLKTLIAKKKAIKQGAMQELLSGKKRLKGFDGEWEVKKLGELGRTLGGLSGKTKVDFEGGTYPYITFLNVMNNTKIDTSIFGYVHIKQGEIQNTFSKGDLFFNTSSETPEEVGMCSVLLEDVESLYLNSFCFGYRLFNITATYGLFLSYLINSSVGRELFSSLAQGATRYNLSKSNFNKVQIFVPEYEEQEAIAQILSDMDSEIETSEKYYLQWKENSEEENKLLKHISQLCNKERFLEIIHDFIVFDKGVKKLCRHNQYFGVKAAQERVQKREGGIIWHTQGSGKSLTMVWLTKWLRENIDDARVLIITDREELDGQIEKVFKGVQEDIYRTTSGRDLIDTLNQKNEWLICSLVHKFGGKDEANFDAFAEELTRSLPKDFKAKGNLFVFVDECHRTQSGSLNKAMRQILPNGIFVGFTGTPLLKKDKQKSIEIFGSYIHTYKFDEAVNDKVVLDLRYEARNVDQNITSQSKIDQWFDAKTRGLTDIAKQKLKRRWGTMQKVLSSQDRLNRIVDDVLMDFELKDRLQNGTGNAMLVSGSIYQACRYYEIFQQKGFKRCAIITSYNPTLQRIKDETTGEEGYTEKLMQYETYKKMLNGKTTEDFELEAKTKFIDEPAQMKLLIVVDKLLTGFDAPSATYLYIDKQMRDHGLFQAICRVNRLDGESKEYGYIIDYKDLFKSLENSINDYTKEAFGEFESDDVQGLLDNRLEKAKERLENARETIKALCEPVFPQTTINFQRFFCGKSENKDDLKDTEPLRVHLYKYTVSLIRSYANIANEMEDAGYSPSEIETIKQEVKFYTNLRDEIEKASGDYIDLKRFEPAMRHLIDSYIRADESEKISAFDDLSLIQLIVERGEEAVDSLPEGIRKDKEAVAETIENNLRKVIIEEAPTNPRYFEKMSVILDELILERKREAFDYKKYLQKIITLTKRVTRPNKTSDYPRVLDTNAKRALYDNLGKDEALAILMDEAVKYNKQADFRGNKLKEKKIKIAIKHILPNGFSVDEIFEIIKNQNEY